jgi:hypothetical protein
MLPMMMLGEDPWYSVPLAIRFVDVDSSNDGRIVLLEHPVN